jgi:hypothetical protein
MDNTRKPERHEPAYYADTSRFLERRHAAGGYTSPDTKPGKTYTLPTDIHVASEHRDNAWYLDACHAAINAPEPVIALRSLLQAARYQRTGARGTTEHDAFIDAQHRVEALLEPHTSTAPLAVPTVHLNGTSGERLVEALQTACRSIGAAESALQECEPHARDYDSSTFDRAQHEHRERAAGLISTRTQLQTVSLAVHNQIADRVRR